MTMPLNPYFGSDIFNHFFEFQSSNISLLKKHLKEAVDYV